MLIQGQGESSGRCQLSSYSSLSHSTRTLRSVVVVLCKLNTPTHHYSTVHTVHSTRTLRSVVVVLCKLNTPTHHFSTVHYLTLQGH